MSALRRRHRGFTLIEVMVTVAIIGILASIAVPVLSGFQYRAKSAERKFLLQAIYRSVDDLFIRDGRFQTDLGGNDSMLNLTVEQPDATPSPAKGAWRVAITDPADQWSALPLLVDGAVYYRYGGLAIVQGSTRQYWLWARGDLDGDGVVNRWDKFWIWNGAVKQTLTGSNLDCNDCSLAVETGVGSW